MGMMQTSSLLSEGKVIKLDDGGGGGSISTDDLEKINSELTEPLNLLIYLNDMSVMNEESYVLAEQNEPLWKRLILESISLYGNKALHETVYNRFTPEEIDYMLENSPQVGESLNRFYKVNLYESGPINKVITNLNSTKFNALDEKFLNGINRYIDKKTAGEGAGQWLSETFSVPELAEKTDMASIISDTALWQNTIQPNEALRCIVCNSVASTYYAGNNEISDEVYHQFLAEIVQYVHPMMDYLEQVAGHGKLADFFNDEEIINLVAQYAPGVNAIVHHLEAFAALIESSTAMDIITQGEVSAPVLAQGVINATVAESALANIKKRLGEIDTLFDSVENSEYSHPAIVNTMDVIDDCKVTYLDPIIKNIEILIENVHSLLDSETAMTAVAASETAMTAVAASETAMTAVAASETAMTAVAASGTAMTAVAASGTAMTAVAASETAMTAVSKSAVALYAISTTANSANKVKTVIQSYYKNVLAAINAADSIVFKVEEAQCGDGSGTFTASLNAPNVIALTVCNDDGDTNFSAYYGADQNYQINSCGSHSGDRAVTGVSMRGIKVTGSGSSVGYYKYKILTKK